MTIKELQEWHKWYRQYKNGYHMSDNDKQELIRLNYLVMELTHEVHNDNMMGLLKK